MEESSNTFCSVPWTQLATNSSGNYRVCCNALPNENLVRNVDQKPMSIFENTVDEAWSSPTYQKIRQQFLNNERPKMCERCFREEDSGLESARIGANKRWISSHQSNPTPPLDVKYIDLRLGNLCNLKCRMCNPYASSKWVDEWNQVSSAATLTPHFSLSEQQKLSLKKMDWPELDATWKNLEPLLNSVEEIYLTGGEPFLSLEQVQFLNKLISSGRSQHIVLKYNTNLTVLPEKLVTLWAHFKMVRLNVSIDGLDSLANYIRFPTDWSVVLVHLQKLFSLQKNGLPLDINIHCTVQMYNILVLNQLLDFLKKEFSLTPYLNILNHPHCLNIRTLPQHLKKIATEKLSEFESDSRIKSVSMYMNKESWFERYYNEFTSYTQTLDKIRNQNFRELQPDFYS